MDSRAILKMDIQYYIGMAPTKVRTSDPCSLGLPEVLTVAAEAHIIMGSTSLDLMS